MLRLPAFGRALAGAAHSKGNLASTCNGKTTHISENMHKVSFFFYKVDELKG